MFWVLFSGLMVGSGLWLGLSRLVPAHTPLAAAAVRLQRAGRSRHVVDQEDDSFAGRVGRLLLPRVDVEKIRLDRVAKDLAVTGRSLEVHLGQKVLWAVLGAVFVPVMAGLLALGGTHVSLIIPTWMSLVAGFAGFFIPDTSVREIANSRRKEFRQSLGAYIDLVVMLLAANEGVTGALEHAANAGDTWPFLEVRRVLSQARLTAVTPWTALRDLGERYGVDELIELASSAQLSGTEGASVRQSLVAKAGTLRDRSLSAEEAVAEQASTRMVFPLLILVMSFVLFLGYPALMSVLKS
jgi:tight adherence protein C